MDKKASTNFAFIDSQNLNLGVRSLGWRLDYRRFRTYLRDKYHIEKAFMFIGLVPNNQSLYTELQSAGFILIFKPTVCYFDNGQETVKGNVDAELVLHAAAIQYSSYDKALIVTGDGDFACLVEFLLEKGKLLRLMCPNMKYSKLLAQYNPHIVRIDKIIASFGNKKDRDKRSDESLGSLDHGDSKNILKKTKNVNAPIKRRGMV